MVMVLDFWRHYVLINALSARSYAETEFWFSSIKVTAIILFILIGGAAVLVLLILKEENPHRFFHILPKAQVFFQMEYWQFY